ncbi:hypothetical protein JTE90_006319 [Oedothorax gibbosus]|uniref:Uncharacterized protein n=1 Tax=Oedothorax gibbosus TaxID=931172 RepID=A0AAV6U3R7_9ARAC|nr:hypothetical protein JTE90_006319 [Oedothorax gibbosus]
MQLWSSSPVFKSSRCSIWLIHFVVNEQPPQMRWANDVVAGLWVGAGHVPDMILFTNVFVEDVKELSVSPVQWQYKQTIIGSRVFCICACVDSPARAMLQNTVEYNGYFECSCCLQKGSQVNGCVKYPVQPGDLPKERALEQMIEDMEEAASLVLSGSRLNVNGESVSKCEVSQADDLLSKFVVTAQQLDGEAAMTSNVHQLLHIANSVLMLGPLWAHSANVFEGNMGSLLNMVTAAKGVLLPILNRYSFTRKLHEICDTQKDISEKVKSFVTTCTKRPPLSTFCYLVMISTLLELGSCVCSRHKKWHFFSLMAMFLKLYIFMTVS